MSQTTHYHIAIDIGAGSGRLFAGYLKEDRLVLDEVHRFETGDLVLKDTHVRNIYRWHEEIIYGLQKFVEKYGPQLDSLGCDSFGSDFVLLDGRGNIPKMPMAYRYNKPQQAAIDRMNEFGREHMFSICGNHSMNNDTVLQMIHESMGEYNVMEHSRGFLFFGDIFQYFLCGKACTELSMASYSKMMNQRTWQWEDEIFDYFGLDDSLKMPVVRSCDRLGEVYEDICKAVGLKNRPEVVTPAIHDTADAAFVMPDPRPGSYFNSSGSWSLLGISLDHPVLSAEACAFNASNSNMPLDRYMFKKNVAGMWLVQRCQSEWKAYSFAQIAEMARHAPVNHYYIDPDAERFFNPECMSKEICRDVNERCGADIQENDVARIARIAFESLALKYRYTLENLARLDGVPAERFYIMGGGSQNELLNQFAANACGIPVFAGIPEASVAGNILCQMIGMGELPADAPIDELIRRSFQIKEYMPENLDEWNDKYDRFLKEVLSISTMQAGGSSND